MVAISESGSHVAVAHAVNKISVFNAETGTRQDASAPVARSRWAVREVGGDGEWSEPIEGEAIPIEALAVSENGAKLACALKEKVLIIDVGKGTVESQLIGHNHPVKQICLLHDDALVATASMDRTIRIWKTSTGDRLGFLSGEAGDPGVIGMGANRTRIGASGAGSVRIWDVDQLNTEVLVRDHQRGVSQAAISRDGKKAVTGSWDGTIILWDLNAAALITRMVGHSNEVGRVAINENGSKVVSGAVNGEVILWDFNTSEGHLVCKHGDDVMAVRITPSGDRIVSVSLDYSLMSLDVASRQGFRSAEHFTYVNDVALTRDGLAAVTVSDDCRVLFWNLLEEGVAGQVDLRNMIRRVLITPDERFAVAATEDRLFLVELPTMRVKHKTKKQNSFITAVTLSPIGAFAVTGHDNGDIRVIDLGNHSEINLPAHSKAVNALGVTADGKRVVSASEDGTVRVTTINGGVITAEFMGDSGIHTVAVSPTSEIIVAGEKSGNVHILALA